MIDTSVFGQLMGALAVRIGKPLTEDAAAMYHAILSEELTTEQFQHGMKAIFRDHKFATWPAPAEIIERATPSRALDAAEAWAALEQALRLRMPEQPLIGQLRALGVDELAVATFLALGGIPRWRALSDFRFDELRREFLAHYGDLTRLPAPERRAYAERKLGPSGDAPRVGRGAPEPVARLVRGVAPYSPGDAE